MNVIAKIVSKEEIQSRQGFTGADWWFDASGDIQVRVEKLETKARTYSLLIHEVVEAVICKLTDVSVADVDRFDRQFEIENPDNHGIEAGDAPKCPYGEAHMIATACERMVGVHLGIGKTDSWSDYDKDLAQK
jgi:hypothetical protein